MASGSKYSLSCRLGYSRWKGPKKNLSKILGASDEPFFCLVKRRKALPMQCAERSVFVGCLASGKGQVQGLLRGRRCNDRYCYDRSSNSRYLARIMMSIIAL